MQKRLHLLVALLAFMVTTAMAQIMAKTSLAQQSRLFTNLLVQFYRAVTNMDGRYSIQGMRLVDLMFWEATTAGLQEQAGKGYFSFSGQNTVLNETLAEDAASWKTW